MPGGIILVNIYHMVHAVPLQEAIWRRSLPRLCCLAVHPGWVLGHMSIIRAAFRVTLLVAAL